VNKQNNQTV